MQPSCIIKKLNPGLITSLRVILLIYLYLGAKKGALNLKKLILKPTYINNVGNKEKTVTQIKFNLKFERFKINKQIKNTNCPEVFIIFSTNGNCKDE